MYRQRRRLENRCGVINQVKRRRKMAEDSILKIVEKLGELSGVVSGLSDKIDNLKHDMIGTEACKNIVHEAIQEHEDRHHGKSGGGGTGISLTPKQKQAIIGSIVAILTGAAGFVTAKFGM